jgi:WD40 repeat protein
VQFADLQGVQVPGVDLSDFDSAQLHSHVKEMKLPLSVMTRPCGSGILSLVNAIKYCPAITQKSQVSCIHPKTTCSMDHTVRLWHLDSGECARILSGHNDKVLDVAFSPQGHQIASASRPNSSNAGVEIGGCSLIVSVCRIAYSPKVDQVTSNREDGTVRFWDAETGMCHRTLTGHTSATFSVVYSPTGDPVASGSGDKTVRLWNISVGASRSVSSRHIKGALCIKYSPEGGVIAARSSDNTIRLHDMETGALRRQLRGHSGTIFGAVYSPQVDQIASASADMTVRLWSMSGECQGTLTGHSNGVNCVVYSPKGDYIVSASNGWNSATLGSS